MFYILKHVQSCGTGRVLTEHVDLSASTQDNQKQGVTCIRATMDEIVSESTSASAATITLFGSQWFNECLIRIDRVSNMTSSITATVLVESWVGRRGKIASNWPWERVILDGSLVGVITDGESHQHCPKVPMHAVSKVANRAIPHATFASILIMSIYLHNNY